MNSNEPKFYPDPPEPDILDDDLTNQFIRGDSDPHDEEIEFWDKCAIAALSTGMSAKDAARRADRTLSARRCRHHGQKMPIE